MTEIKFVATIEKSTGLQGKGKNQVYSFKSHRKEMTQKQASAYLKRTYGAMAYIGTINVPILEIYPTLDGRFAIEVFSKGNRKKSHVSLIDDFDEVVDFIQKKIKDPKISVKISKLVFNGSAKARKYNYKTDTE